MGYIGFGLQKWIYKQKARRPFSNSRNGISEDSSFSKNFNVPVGAYNKEQAIENRFGIKDPSQSARYHQDLYCHDFFKYLNENA